MAVAMKTCANEQEAEKYIESYMREYHPAGYGTQAHKDVQPDGTVIVTMTRYDSCD